MQRRQARRGALALGSFVAAAAMVLVGSPAMADTSRVSGDLNRSGALVQYDYTRTHTFTGPIALNVTKMPGSQLRLGLRNMKAAGGPQFTNTTVWNSRGHREFTANGTTTILRQTRFALQGRMGSCGWPCSVSWSGTLSY